MAVNIKSGHHTAAHLPPRREAALVSNRARQLVEAYTVGGQVMGAFDLAHLRAVHRYLFQDVPGVHPGEIRGNGQWSKHRKLEGDPGTYVVNYAPGSCGERITAALRALGDPSAIRDMAAQAMGFQLARLYGDLDYAHGFYEGNSRTLREFFRQLAASAGHTLVWGPKAAGAVERNALYIARDVEVLERAWPGLTPEKGVASDDPAEYEASLALPVLRRRMGATTLTAIISAGLTAAPARSVRPVSAVEDELDFP
jgi:fido (protein-threonine AMPylation protein)